MWSFNVILRNSVKFNLSTLKRSMHLLKNQAYVNGNWISSKDNKTFEITNPVDGSVVGTAPDMSAEDAIEAIDDAHAAFKEWSELTGKDRSVIMRKWYNLMVEYSEDLAKIITAESGKPLMESRAEVTYGNSFVEFFAEEARRINGEIISSPNKSKQILLYKQPIGVAGLITPWNFPHAMITRKAGAALAAGCSVVIRPAEDTPLTALTLAQLAHEAGLPKGVFNVITSSRDNAGIIGKVFCESPRIAGISFTGSIAVGKLLYRQCASGVKRLALELSGNAPFIVFESANIDKAVQGALAAKFRNLGQSCVAANRVMIQESIFDEFVEKFKEGTEKIVMGNGIEENVMAGPVINKAQMTKVANMVQDAIDKGAQVVTGGEPATDFGELFFQPTILKNVKKDMICYNEEVFGPVAACIPFKAEEEVLAIANCAPRGLAGYFYSEDVSQIFRVARHLEVGMVGVNEGIISMAEAAFGGIKESGLGREGSHHGIDDFVFIKYMCLGNMS